MNQITKKQLEEMAKAVYQELGADHLEDIYKHALLVELRAAGFEYDCEQTVEVRYKGHFVGWGYADIIVRCGSTPNVLLELKRNKKISKADVQQARNYMKQLKIENGFVINFGSNGNTDVDEDPKKSKALEVAVKEVSLND